MYRGILAGGLLAVALTLAACGGTPDSTGDAGDGPASGTCLEGTPDCDDTGILDGNDAQADPAAGMCAPEMADCLDTPDLAAPASDDFDDQTAIAEAQALLELSEAQLGPDVRIGRRGEEQMLLTEDYVLGRMTVELDINDMDEWIVTAVTVELPDAPQTFTRYLT